MKTKALAVLLTAFLLPVFFEYVYSGSQQVSSTAASTIITRARYYLDAPGIASGDSFWSDARLLQWLNDGQVDIATRTHCMEDTETETLLTSTLSYALSDNFITIKAVIYNNEKALKKGSIEHIGEVEALGEPAYWVQWEDSVIVYPAPSSSVTGNSIVVYVVDRPSTLASTDTITIPVYYERALVLYMVTQAFYYDQKFAQAAQMEAQYHAELDRYRQDFSNQPPSGQVR